jgi:hypothetical protein
MKLHIADHKTISQVQREFSGLFPYLKVEFFSKPHKNGKGSAKAYMQDAGTTIGECRVKQVEGDLLFDSSTRVTELEEMFHNEFGLNVQVFRKSGKLWLETTATDSWTLAEQNNQGEELNNVQGNQPDEEFDYHEQE